MLLEKFGFAYENVANKDLQAGDLKSKYEVAIFPDQPARGIMNGYAKDAMPEEYTGGVGESDVAAVKQFANAGGTVLCFNHASSFCIANLGAQAKKTEKTGFYSPGSLLNTKLDLSSPLTRGLPEQIAIWSEQSPAFTSEQQSVATYPANDILVSGWLLGANLIANKSAMIDSKVGEGHIVLFGIRLYTEHRVIRHLSYSLML